jgi:hypothetical protein
MSQKKVEPRYRVVSDNDGHDYIIKAGHEGDFYNWVEATEEGTETEFDFESCRVNNSGWTFADPQGY